MTKEPIMIDGLETKIANLSGNIYGKLIVTNFAYRKRSGKNYKYYWTCQCDCGGICTVESYNLKSGITKSCGCYREDFRKKHNLTRTRLYRIWRNIRSRCNNPNTKNYKRYGGRGITVCDEWLNENDFMKFYDWALSNGYQDGLTLDRIDNNGNYEPNNCRWTTMEEQSQNTSKAINITYNNETYSLSKWSRKTGISRSTLYTRYKSGWGVEKMLTTKVGE